jgi:hypothetical protein
MRNTADSKLLKPAAIITSVLLGAGALLAALEIWDDGLNWDFLAGPMIQSSMLSGWALGTFGFALTVILGIREMIMILRNNATERHGKGQPGQNE